jgi:hypothetical protein
MADRVVDRGLGTGYALSWTRTTSGNAERNGSAANNKRPAAELVQCRRKLLRAACSRAPHPQTGPCSSRGNKAGVRHVNVIVALRLGSRSHPPCGRPLLTRGEHRRAVVVQVFEDIPSGQPRRSHGEETGQEEHRTRTASRTGRASLEGRIMKCSTKRRRPKLGCRCEEGHQKSRQTQEGGSGWRAEPDAAAARACAVERTLSREQRWQ